MSSEMTSPGWWRKRLLVLGVMLLGLALFLWVLRPKQPLYAGDPLHYLSGAKSLAEGTGYRMVVYEGNPRIGLYPPLQSLFLSAFWRMGPAFPENIALLHGAMISLLLGCAGVVFWMLVRNGMPLSLAALLAVCLALGTDAINWLFVFMSDFLFTLLSALLALWWLGRPQAQTDVRWVGTGIVLGLMYLTRTAAAPVLLGVIILLAVKGWRERQWKPFLLCASPIVYAVVFWGLMPKETAAYSSYFQKEIAGTGTASSGLTIWAGYASGCAWRAYDYGCRQVAECLWPSLYRLLLSFAPRSRGWMHIADGVAVLAALGFIWICVTGYVRNKSTITKTIGVLLALYYVQLILWPFPLGTRVLLPLLPFLCYGFWTGCQTLPEKLRNGSIRAVIVILAVNLPISVILSLCGKNALTWDAGTICSTAACEIMSGFSKTPHSANGRYAELKELVAWTREHVPASARIGTEHGWQRSSFPMLHFVEFSGHKLTQTSDEDRASMLGQVDYVLGEGKPTSAKPVDVKDRAAGVKVVFRSSGDNFHVLRVLH